MSRFRPSLPTLLIVLPYILLSAAIWLTIWPLGEPLRLVWDVDFRWPLRAFYLGAVILGWRAGRPSWFYSWLGFAVWESFSMLLDFSGWLPGALEVDSHEVVARLISNGIRFLAFVLYLLVPLWAGWRRPGSLLGAYTVFPHAALTSHLVFFATRALGFPFLFWVMAIPSAGVSAAAALLFWSPPAFLVRAGEAIARGALLYGGVLLAQLTLWVGMGLDGSSYAQRMNESLFLGWLLLSAAVLFPFLAGILVWLFKFSFGRVFKASTCGRPHSDDETCGQSLGRDESGTD